MNNTGDLEMVLLDDNDESLVFGCPVCGAGDIHIYKHSIRKYGYCTVCDTAYIHYVPLPHQLEIHESDSKIKLLIGGMGSAKSDAGVMEIINHALSTPNGRTIMLAQTLKQLGAAILPKFAMYLPDKHIDVFKDTRSDKYIKLDNGHEIIGFASDDEEKFRSLDISAFLLEEASGIKPSIYQELIRRLRHPLGIVNGVSHYVGVVVSNPSQGFIRDLLFRASKIVGSKSIKSVVKDYEKRVKDANPDLAAFLSSSRDNPYLPEGFVDSVINSLTEQQVKLYVDCIIEYAEGAVYDNFLEHVVDDFEIPSHWPRYLAHDPGINDPSAVLISAWDPKEEILYLYKEFYKTNVVLSTVANKIKEMIHDIPQGMLNPMLIDPSSKKRNQIDAKTYKKQMTLEHRLVFHSADNSLIDGIAKTRDLFKKGKIKTFRSLINTISEGCEYRYATEKERSSKKNAGDKPLDKDNHLMDCLRYIVQALPYFQMIVQKQKEIESAKSWKDNFLINKKKPTQRKGGYTFD